MTSHSAHKVAQMLADGFQSHDDRLVLETSTQTQFEDDTFEIEHDDGTVYYVTVVRGWSM